MMLHPLAEVGIGMFVPIMVGRCQLVMDILCDGEGGNGEQKKDQADRHCAAKNGGQTHFGSA
jgi:hypothetical protein